MYDGYGQMTSRTDALGNAESYEYDTESNVSSHTDRNGVKTVMTYNMYHDLVRRSTQDGELSESFGYDGLGRLSYCIGSGMRYDYAYDVMDRLIRKSASGKTLLDYTYDTDGNVIKMIDITGKDTEYKYDILGQLETVTDNGTKVATYSYDKAGQRTGSKFGTLVEQTRSYTADGLVAGIKTEYIPQGRMLLEDVYSYDGNANLIGKRTLTGESAFSYDALNRLTEVTVTDKVFADGNYKENFSYDSAGNRLTRTHECEGRQIIEKYKYDAGNRLLRLERLTRQLEQLDGMSVSNETSYVQEFNYDNQGNMLSDSEFEYSYDNFNRLVAVKGVSADKLGKTLVNRYDAEGLRHEMEENGRLVQFIFSREEVVTETTDDNSVIRYIR